MRHPLLRLAPLAVALSVGFGPAAHAADTTKKTSQADLLQLLEQLNQRMEKLEQRNADLERQLLQRDAPAAAATSTAKAPAAPVALNITRSTSPELEARLQALEAHKNALDQGMESEEISEREPEITARLKAVEYQSLNMLKAARTIGALDGITAGISFTTVAQKPYGLGNNSAVTGSQLNYRGDVFVTLPLDNIGDIESRVFAQFRLGQGQGLNGIDSFAKPNASAFRVQSSQPDDSVAVLGQAWYQATIPLPFGGYKPRSREKLEINFGKMDPFVFFDQNAAANDETRQFLNTVFVHNPLLDAGGDIGVDANGFAPGFRMSYFNEEQKPENWRASVGIFGAGPKGSNYQRSLSSPLIIGQLETSQKYDGLTGNYRVYYWQNGQALKYGLGEFLADGVTPNPSYAVERHSGWGLSFDQRIDDGLTFFGRYGQQITGNVRFDRALTVGAEINGLYWDRGGDSMGVALGWLKSGKNYRTDAPLLIENSYAPQGAERVAEVYYRYRINKQFELTPDFQYFGKPASNPDLPNIKVIAVRAQISY